MKWMVTGWWLAAGIVWTCAVSAMAQRVQIPQSTIQPQMQPFAQPPAGVGGSTFPAPSLSPSYPSYGGTVGGATTYGTAPIGPPPGFDAYAPGTVGGTTLGPPPQSVPYNYSPQGTAFPTAPANPYGAQPYAQPGVAAPANTFPAEQSLYPDGLPFDWQQGTYGYQSSDGSLVRFQKFLQRLGMEYTWLAGNGGLDDFELTRAEFAATFGIPVLHNVDTPLLVTPGFAFNWLEGPIGDPMPPVMMPPIPRGPDLPGQLYDAYLDFSWYPKPFEWFGAELGVRTGVWSDFDSVNSDSVRILGRGLGVISITPQMEVLIGAVYLDRLRVKVLPAGGVHWRPNQDWDLYLVFPNPKIRRRFPRAGNTDWWWFASGEYGGGSWTVDRVGLADRIDYNDIRFSLGLEFETPNMVRGHFEVGYVFDREIIFESGMPDKFTPDDTVMLRAGIDF